MDPTVTIDITGFYYRASLPFLNGDTVLSVLERAAEQATPDTPGASLAVKRTAKGFVCALTVEFPSGEPRSRQQGSDELVLPRDRFFSYEDDVTSAASRISSTGGQAGFVVWQYYVFGADGSGNVVPKNGSVITNGPRRIVPASEFALSAGDTVVWRAVGIFGFNAEVDVKLARRRERGEMSPICFKEALALM